MNTYQRIENLRKLPWYSIDPPADVVSGGGMVHDDERRMLYTLARDYYVGDGRIIDGGTFLGSSSLALGSGLKDRFYKPERVIDAYDLFVIDEGSVVLLNPDDALSRHVKAGDNVRRIYERNISSVKEYIDIHEGNLKAKTWSGFPIEILFCDVAKDFELNDYVVQNWIACLMPETGILIQQDQVQQYHIWVAVTMEILSDYFEVIDYTKYSSVVYRLKYEIPARAPERTLFRNVSMADVEYYYLQSLDRFRRNGMGRYKGWQLGMVELGLAVTYGFHIGDIDRAQYELDRIAKQFSDIPDTMLRLSEIQGHLTARTPCPGSRLYWSS